MKRIGIATFAALLLAGATAFAADQHHGGGGGAPHGGAAPHGGGGGGAPHMGGGGFAPHGGGGGFAAHGGGGFAPRSGGGVSRGDGMENFSHATPSRSFGQPRGGVASFSHAAPSHQGFSERRGGYASFSHANVNRNSATFHSRGMEAPRGGTQATYMHRQGRYGSMEHGNAVARPNGRAGNYPRDARGFGTRPSNWNQRPHNFDRGAYQRNVTAGERFHYGSYDRPSGWYYRRWAYGDTFPAIFWARDYWLTDWWMFDLPIPPYGFEWVRYGDDAILVNVYTGQILQVDYGVFY